MNDIGKALSLTVSDVKQRRPLILVSTEHGGDGARGWRSTGVTEHGGDSRKSRNDTLGNAEP